MNANLINKLLIVYALLLLFSTTSCTGKELPYLGQSELNPDTGDSIHHQVQEFSFINQNGDIVNQNYLKNKITVVSFFFTSCPSICPTMTTNLKYLQKEVKGKFNIQIVTHTVDPQKDSVERLKWYISKNKIDTSNWTFLTGNQQALFESGVYNYLLAAQEDVLAPGGFLHSEKFVLVDKNLHLRGFYNGTDKKEITQLITDIEILENE